MTKRESFCRSFFSRALSKDVISGKLSRKYHEIGAHGAAGTDLIAPGKKDVNNGRNTGFPCHRKISGTDDRSDRHKTPP
jgi:hypothetical protein